MISFDEFKKTELLIGAVLSAERVEGSEKLLKLRVNLGGAGSPSTSSGQLSGVRQIIAGIGTSYHPEELVGRSIAIVANLEPRTFTLRGASGQVGHYESQGMLLAARDAEGRPVILTVEREVPPGATVT